MVMLVIPILFQHVNEPNIRTNPNQACSAFETGNKLDKKREQ